MWLVYQDLRNDWANLRQTFRDCCGQAGDCPWRKKIQNVDSLSFEDYRFATHLLNCSYRNLLKIGGTES